MGTCTGGLGSGEGHDMGRLGTGGHSMSGGHGTGHERIGHETGHGRIGHGLGTD
jgi:hypothetical protein